MINKYMTTMESTIDKHVRFQLTDKTREWIVYGICLFCLALFATAAYGKVMEHQTFVKGLSRVPFIKGAALYIAWLVPTAEIVISALLIVPQTQKWGLYAFTILMAVFTLYITGMWLWAEKLPCHCNLIIEKLSWGQHIWFNLGFIALAIVALWLSSIKHN